MNEGERKKTHCLCMCNTWYIFMLVFSMGVVDSLRPSCPSLFALSLTRSFTTLDKAFYSVVHCIARLKQYSNVRSTDPISARGFRNTTII